MAEQLRPGDPATIGPYEIVRHLGSGGMGSVYLGRTPGQRLVAIKVIHPQFANDPEFRARFAREITAATRVNGLFTAQVISADPRAPVPWLATAYINGPSLQAVVSERGPLPAEELPQLAAGLAEALQAIHAAGLVHRDLKPSNVLLAADGPRVIDFGISRAHGGTQLTSPGAVFGTPAYMSPEQIEGREITRASDVFALGSVLTYAATGADPFSKEGGQSLVAQGFRVLTAVPDLAGVPGTIRPLIAACLEKNPADRPTTDEILRGLLILQTPPERAEHALAVTGLPEPPEDRPVVNASPRPAADNDTFARTRAGAIRPAESAPEDVPPAPLGARPRRGFGAAFAALLARAPRRSRPGGGSGSSPESPRSGAASVGDPLTLPPERFGRPLADDFPPVPSAAAAPAASAPALALEARTQVVDPASITSRDSFCAALDEVREQASLSVRDVAIANGLLLSTVRGYFERGRLPAERDVLRQILRACAVPEEDVPGWDEALIRVRAQRQRGAQPPAPQAGDERVFVFGPAIGPAADGADLLFHVYIPKTELYAEQRRETLRHFREYLTTVEGQDIRQEDFSGQNGETVSFYVAPGQPRPPLHEKIQEFANFVDHCAHSPMTAVTHLTRIGLPEGSSATVVASYAKRFHRMEMDLRHERTNRINALAQQLESELLDEGGDPDGIATLQISIRSVLEQAIPPPTAVAAMPSLGAGQEADRDAAPSGTGQPQTGTGAGRTIQGIVRASRSANAAVRDQRVYSQDPTVPTNVYNAAINSVHGTAHFGPEARRLLGLIERYGDEETGPLRSALHEIEDPGIPAKTKTAASRRLTAFLADLASKIPDIGIGLLERYLEARTGVPGR